MRINYYRIVKIKKNFKKTRIDEYKYTHHVFAKFVFHIDNVYNFEANKLQYQYDYAVIVRK